MNLKFQIDDFLGQIMRFSENNHEILLGKCESEIKLTSTQEHILMLLMNETSTNARMAEHLNISPAAVTKALKKLQELNLIDSVRTPQDERVVMWSLTPAALPIAREHAEHHAKTLDAYEKIVEKFSPDEQKVIVKFITELSGEFQ